MVAHIIEAVSQTTKMPVEVSDVAGIMVQNGIQDEIEFYGVERDPAVFLGTFRRYCRHDVPYGEPQFVSQVIYNSNLPLAWQRVVACKELVHVFDPESEWTRAPDQVTALMESLLDSPEELSDAAILGMALTDRFAIFPATGALFPDAARTEALQAIESSSVTIDDVARWVDLPRNLVQAVLTENWPRILSSVINGTDPDQG